MLVLISVSFSSVERVKGALLMLGSISMREENSLVL